MTKPSLDIRPFELDDLEVVAALFQRILRSGGAVPSGLVAALRRVYLDAPGRTAGRTSLVAVDAGDQIVAFLGVMGRRLKLGDETLALACSGPLIVDRERAAPGAGLLLTRALFKQGWDLAITDGATKDAVDLWRSLGAFAPGLSSIQWTRTLRPFCHRRGLLLDHPRLQSGLRRTLVEAGRWLEGPVDGLLRRLPRSRFAAPGASASASETPLTPASWLPAMERLARSWRLRPDYDEAELDWLLGELSRLESRGSLRRILVRSDRGEILGWFLYFLVPGGTSRVLQLAARPGSESDVLQHLFADADRHGAAAVEGRVEPAILAAIDAHPLALRYGPPYSVVWTRRTDVLAVLHRGESLLTRLEAEWWLAFHQETYA